MIDDRLREIILAFESELPKRKEYELLREGELEDFYLETIKVLKQAFKEEGYTLNLKAMAGWEGKTTIRTQPMMTRAEWEEQAKKEGWKFNPSLKEMAGYKINTKPTMTGQAWFDRFKEELGDIKIAELAVDGNYHQLMRDKALGVARKASGIKE